MPGVLGTQGDEFVLGLAEGTLLSGDQLHCLRLSACGISDEGACVLSKALEAVGESAGICTGSCREGAAA